MEPEKVSFNKVAMWSYIVTGIALVAAFLYGSWSGVVLCVILGVLEVSLSFDNAVINATILGRMNEFWQRIFLSVGVIIAVVGMRFLLPLVIVWLSSGLAPLTAFILALNPPAAGALVFPDGSPSYQLLLTDAHPLIAAFGGMFLLLLFLDYIFETRQPTWLTWIERPLAKIGGLDRASVIVGIVVVITLNWAFDLDKSMIVAALLGTVTYMLVNALGEFFQTEEDEEPSALNATIQVALASGKTAFFLFLYLEVLDASFSFDGVIGAFSITPNPIYIALGLGFIGSMFVRSLTVYLVRTKALATFRYLEHGAHWAIGFLAVVTLLSIHFEISQYVTGLTGVGFIGAAFVHSILANRKEKNIALLRAGYEKAQLAAQAPLDSSEPRGPLESNYAQRLRSGSGY